MEFEPLLPDDDAALAERVDGAVGLVPGIPVWLRHRGAGPQGSALPARSPKCWRTSPRSRAADRSALEPTEIEEDAYAELVEFVRVGVQLIYDELLERHARRRTPPVPTTSRH